MIELTKLNNEKYYMNCELIECIEKVPDTLITMTNGRKYYALESAEEVIAKVTEYRRSLFENCANASKRKRKAPEISNTENEENEADK